MRPTILTFGEIIWDIYDNEQVIGGAAFNFASHCSKCGSYSALFSAVGQDDLGIKALEYAKENRIETSLIQSNEKKTGQCLVSLDEKKVPTFHVLEDVAYDNLTFSDENLEKITKLNPDAFYFGTLIQRSSQSETALKNILNRIRFPEVICDINLRKNCYSKQSILLCLENATIIKLSDEEEPILREIHLYDSDNKPENIVRALSEICPKAKVILLTCGSNGAYAYDVNNDSLIYEPAKEIVPISSVGAGDSFTAAFTVSYLKKESLKTSLIHAVELSAFVVSETDAVPAYGKDKFDWIK